jgi:serine/threonine protein kinase
MLKLVLGRHCVKNFCLCEVSPLHEPNKSLLMLHATHSRIIIRGSQVLFEKRASSGLFRKLLENEKKAMEIMEGINAPILVSVELNENLLTVSRAFLPGTTLHQTPKKSWPTVLRTLAENIKHSHARGLIHGDLKPSNIIVDGSRVTPIDWEHALPVGARLEDQPLRAFSPGTTDPRLIWAKGAVSGELDQYSIERMLECSRLPTSS